MEINVQDVFNKVIDSGYYPEYTYMCIALREAFCNGEIGYDELVTAAKEIGKYLKGYSTLYGRMNGKSGSGLDNEVWAEKEGVKIYRNWENRPMPEKSIYNRDSEL